MTPRRCPVCGVSEQRQRDTFGRETVNLCPFTDKCVDCLCKGLQPKPMVAERVPFDYGKAAANDREDRE